jgi:hypothetical protein
VSRIFFSIIAAWLRGERHVMERFEQYTKFCALLRRRDAASFPCPGEKRDRGVLYYLHGHIRSDPYSNKRQFSRVTVVIHIHPYDIIVRSTCRHVAVTVPWSSSFPCRANSQLTCLLPISRGSTAVACLLLSGKVVEFCSIHTCFLFVYTCTVQR